MKKSKITIEPATMAYAKEFYGDQCNKSFRGYVALLGGKVIGVGGLSFENETMMLFSDIKEELRPFKRDIVRGFHILERMVAKTNYPIVAVADKKEKLSERILTRIGFTPSGNENQDGSKIYWRVP